ncbi:hypothetical protein AAY473_019408 [Plecturocebus cupreus]
MPGAPGRQRPRGRGEGVSETPGHERLRDGETAKERDTGRRAEMGRRTRGQTDRREVEVGDDAARTPAGHADLDPDWNTDPHTRSLARRHTDTRTEGHRDTVRLHPAKPHTTFSGEMQLSPRRPWRLLLRRGKAGVREGERAASPEAESAAPAPRHRRRPLPDSRPPRVHSDFSAHFSSSPVTPALALPPPAAPPRSASRGNPRCSQPLGRSRLRTAATHPHRAWPRSVPSRNTYSPKSVTHKWTVTHRLTVPPNSPRRGPALVGSTGIGSQRWDQIPGTSGP